MTDREFANFLARYTSRQLENMFPSFTGNDALDVRAVQDAVHKTHRCVSSAVDFDSERFDHLRSGHHATFLYFLSRQLWLEKHDKETATRLFLLNKALNGIDLFYEVVMPDLFLIGHTVGMVFAKARYANYCVFHQGCTVGRSKDDRPVLEEGLIMYPQSSVIGRCVVRSNTVLAPGVQLVNCDTPGNCLVFTGKSGRPVFKSITEDLLARYFAPSIHDVGRADANRSNECR